MSEDALPAVLVHGLIGTLRDPALLGAFGGRPALVPDLLGYGEFAGAPPERITMGAQVGHLRALVEDEYGGGKVHLVGHSVGGAVAVLFARSYPERAASLTSAEGNFTLADAFLSGKIAQMGAEEAEAMMAADGADPAAWLERAGAAPSARRVALARRWLAQQPASTVQAMARSVVEATGEPGYLGAVRAVFDAVPVHLVAGERSRAGWGVPDWALPKAAEETVIPGTGHFMMLEEPATFGGAVARFLDSLPSQRATARRSG